MYNKLSINIAIFALLLFAFQTLGAQAETWVTVQKAVDGDTVRLKDGRSVRLIGIDAPEIDHQHHLHEPMALESWQFISKIVNGKRVRIELDQSSHDSYGRLLAYLFDSQGEMLNQRIVAAGFAHVLYLHPNVRAYKVLLETQRQAMANNEGKWRDFKWVRGPLVGNPRSRRFHEPECPSAIKIVAKSMVRFDSERQAFWEGYAPCRRCLSSLKKKSRGTSSVSQLFIEQHISNSRDDLFFLFAP